MAKRACKRFAVAASRTFAAAIALSFIGTATAQQRELTYRERISGAAAPSSFDVNGDGVPGHYVTFDGWSTMGLVNGALLVEYDFLNLAPDAACGGGRLKVPILASVGNRALTIRGLAVPGGQIFMRDNAAAALFCLDPATGAFTMSLEGAFEGGLGVFEGASGDYSYEGRGQVLLQDFTDATDPVPLPFGGFTLETKGTIVLPGR